MIILIKIEGQKAEITCNGHVTEHKVAFIKKLSFKDFLEYIKNLK